MCACVCVAVCIWKLHIKLSRQEQTNAARAYMRHLRHLFKLFVGIRKCQLQFLLVTSSFASISFHCFSHVLYMYVMISVSLILSNTIQWMSDRLIIIRRSIFICIYFKYASLSLCAHKIQMFLIFSFVRRKFQLFKKNCSSYSNILSRLLWRKENSPRWIKIKYLIVCVCACVFVLDILFTRREQFSPLSSLIC